MNSARSAKLAQLRECDLTNPFELGSPSLLDEDTLRPLLI